MIFGIIRNTDIQGGYISFLLKKAITCQDQIYVIIVKIIESLFFQKFLIELCYATKKYYCPVIHVDALPCISLCLGCRDSSQLRLR